ncbi:MAG: dTDP-4-dehydrorhamnose reductase [Opitutia bacterium UBA7350]|nr:MAG: dTDP-4-dehydrorhamnose reductase [Opitutae bacterium UBA7350]
MKILLTGATGLLGNAYAKAALRRGHSLNALSHTQACTLTGIASNPQLDASNLEALTELILHLWPDVIVNCAALSNPSTVEAQPELARKINIDLPKQLAQLSTHLGSRFIHISTDMVFDGLSEAPYRSTDTPIPTNLYGQTKLIAEREVLACNKEDPVVLRIPILMGNSPAGNRSVHEKLLVTLHEKEQAKLFTDELRQPCSAGNVAEVMLELSERRDLHGLFHWAGSEVLSRFTMGQRILNHLGLPAESICPVKVKENTNCSSRPRILAFNLNPLVSKLKTQPIDFQEQLDEITFIEPLRA